MFWEELSPKIFITPDGIIKETSKNWDFLQFYGQFEDIEEVYELLYKTMLFKFITYIKLVDKIIFLCYNNPVK